MVEKRARRHEKRRREVLLYLGPFDPKPVVKQHDDHIFNRMQVFYQNTDELKHWVFILLNMTLETKPELYMS